MLSRIDEDSYEWEPTLATFLGCFN
jgi:hypothetical protein